MTPEQLAAQQAASQSILGRSQGAEQFDSRQVDMSVVSTQQYRPFTLNRPLESITLELRCRITTTVGNIAAVSPEAIQNLIQRVRLEGQHRIYGNVALLNMSGASLFAAPLLFGTAPGNQILIDSAAQARPGSPFTSAFAGTTAASPDDIIMFVNIPLAPWMGIGPGAKRWATSFLALPGDWNDTLQLTVDVGDKSALGNTTGATVAFTGYGGVALPTLKVHLNYSILGAFQNADVPQGIVIRNERTFNTFVALAAQQRITSLDKRVTNSVIVKSGVLQTTLQSAGVTTFASLSQLMLDRTQIVVDNKAVRNVTSDLAEKSRICRCFDVPAVEGYHALTFIDSQNPLTAYRGDGLAGGSSFDLVADIVSANANNRIHITQEQVVGPLYPSLR